VTVVFRDAVPGDESCVARIVRWIAETERAVGRLTATEAHYTHLMFGGRQVLHGLLAEVDGVFAGGALWYFIAGTFSGNPGLFIEDVAMSPAQRGRGYGHALFAALARRALAEGCDRMEWRVHRDNTAAQHFYRQLSATPQPETTYMRLDGAALDVLAA
jgi:GNAT superfamily N-acetyltransferase